MPDSGNRRPARSAGRSKIHIDQLDEEKLMSGLGGLNKSPHGVVLGVVQLQLPVVKTPKDLAAQTARICEMVAKARRNMGTMDLVVFPEYSLHGLSMDTNPEIMCRLD